MSTNLSVNEFKKTLRGNIEEIASEVGWLLDNSTQRGYAFQLWAARIITNFEIALDTEPEDALLKSQDLGADLVFESSASNHLLICQCKYQSFDKPVDEGEVNDFFHRHSQFLDSAWVKKHASSDAALALQDYRERIESGYSCAYYFISTGVASERTIQLAERCNREFQESGLPITCELLDFTRLKDYYIRSLSLEESVPEEVILDLPQEQFFLKRDPHLTLVAVIKGNTLRNLSKQYKQALYAWNIRGYLGNRGINQDISDTATNNPDYFFYFNNGVSAICTRLELEGNRVRAKKFQIINGAQTVSTLANLTPDPAVEVLFRLTQTQSVTTEKGFNRQIIQYNNSQNIVKVSDFRSNDEIQIFLERYFDDFKARGPLPKLRYLRKRAVGRRGIGLALRLEDMAKVRYSFLYDPTLVHASPKALWTLEEDGGAYEKAFGIDGGLVSAWSAETLDESLAAVAIYLRINQATKDLAKKSAEVRFLPRLRFHGLSLAGLYLRNSSSQIEYKALTRSMDVFESFWNTFWPLAKAVLVDVYSQAEDSGSTMFAFVRSSERWQQMQKRFTRHLASL